MSKEGKSPEDKKELIEKKRDKKKFKRQNSEKHIRLGGEWRKPRGKHSKVRLKHKNKKSMPTTGRRSPKDIRGVHPSGFEEKLVHNLKELQDVDPETEAARIGSKVGKKKREKILEKAEELDIKVLNK